MSNHDKYIIHYLGRSLPLAVWAKELELPYTALLSRKYAGWSDEKIICTPIRGKKPSKIQIEKPYKLRNIFLDTEYGNQGAIL